MRALSWGPITAVRALSPEGSLRELDDSPVSVELAPFCSEAQFDRLVAEAQQLQQLFVIIWASITPRTIFIILAGSFKSNEIILFKHINCSKGTRTIRSVSQI
ncbi:hypothetical protein ABKV19_022604 [Rosa sericea]